MKEAQMEKIEVRESAGRAVGMPEACERALDNVRKSMRHVPGSAFYLPADRRA